MNNLALCIHAIGSPGETLRLQALQEELLVLRHKVNGPEHPNMIKAMGNLAGSYREAGRWDGALRP